MRLRLHQWQCHSCAAVHRGALVKPAEVLQACFFYSKAGRAPWNKTDNTSPITGVVCYCVNCVQPKIKDGFNA